MSTAACSTQPGCCLCLARTRPTSKSDRCTRRSSGLTTRRGHARTRSRATSRRARSASASPHGHAGQRRRSDQLAASVDHHRLDRQPGVQSWPRGGEPEVSLPASREPQSGHPGADVRSASHARTHRRRTLPTPETRLAHHGRAHRDDQQLTPPPRRRQHAYVPPHQADQHPRSAKSVPDDTLERPSDAPTAVRALISPILGSVKRTTAIAEEGLEPPTRGL